MSEHKLYYRFKPIGIDWSDEKEIKKHNLPLTSFECLSEQLFHLDSAYKNKTKDPADIIINAVPEIWGVVELHVCHQIGFKLLSRAVKTNCFSICISKIEFNEEMNMYYYDTEDFSEVRQILQDFIENKKIPDLRKWKCEFVA
ncbi:MAG: hypothetical protein K2J16_07340 [Clostridia bacterium]|nr:hypothetical protein [Clostridia bacterium]